MRLCYTIALVLLSAPAAHLRGDVVENEKRAFDPATCRISSYSEPWLLWTTSELDPSTERDHVPLYNTKVYLQKTGEDVGVVFLTHRVPSGRGPRVLSDGSVYNQGTGRIAWWKRGVKEPEINIVELEGKPLSVQAVFSDGVIAKEKEHDVRERLGNVWWIPYARGTTVMHERVLLTGDRGSLRTASSTFIRRGDRIAWMDGFGLDTGIPKEKQFEPVIYVLDVKQRKVVSEASIPKMQTIAVRDLSSFDGTNASFGKYVVEAATGKVIVEAKGPVLAIRAKDYFFYVKDGEEWIVNRAFFGKEGQTELLRTKHPPGQVFLADGDIVQIWKNDRWESIPK